MEKYDVIIAGAGPAGLSTALHLQQMAPALAERTLVLEKAKHPRPKVCAGGLLPDGDRILGRLGLSLDKIPYEDAIYASFDFCGKGTYVQSEEALLAFHVVQRHEFDGWLAEQAREKGISLLEETPVQHLTLDERGVEVITPRSTYRANVVVGADGAQNVVRQHIIGRDRQRLARALLVLTPLRPGESVHHPENAYLDFCYVPKGIPGYVWDFPSHWEDRPMRCWGVYESGLVAGKRQRSLRSLLAEELARHGHRLEDYTLRGGLIRCFDGRSPFSAPRVLLVGDAAGVDGLFGEGIGPALGYGRLAAEAIVKAFALGDFSFRDYRKQVLQSELGKALRMRAALGRMVYRLQNPLFHKIIWRHSGNLLRWIIWTFLADWAKREDKPNISQQHSGR